MVDLERGLISMARFNSHPASGAEDGTGTFELGSSSKFQFASRLRGGRWDRAAVRVARVHRFNSHPASGAEDGT